MQDYNRKILYWLTKHNREKAHITLEKENEWHKRTRELIMSHGMSKSRGTAILFGNKLDYKIKENKR